MTAVAKRPKAPRRSAPRLPARGSAAAEALVARLASSLGRRDEVPNQELAAEIAAANDASAVKTLVALLADGTKAVRSDCIKVLYEVGERRPRLVAPHVQAFLSALGSHDNRIQWGAMTALSAVTREVPREVYDALPRVIKAARKGSVITRDHAVRILVALCERPRYVATCYRFLLEELQSAPVNQLPMYAELARPVVPPGDDRFIEVLQRRLKGVPQPAKRRRLEKVLKSLGDSRA